MNEWERIDAIEEAQGRPWPVLAITLLVVVALALAAWWPKVDADTDQWRREETAQLVKRAYERRRADSLIAVARAEHRTAEHWRARYVAARQAVTPASTTDTIIDVALPPVRGGWGGVIVSKNTQGAEQSDTLPTPRVVIGLLRERDTALALADTTVTRQRYALASYRATIPAYQSALAHSDTALRVSATRRVAEVGAVKRSRWRWTLYALAAGFVVGALSH